MTITPEDRFAIAMYALRGRFKIARMLHTTDSRALHSARGWANQRFTTSAKAAAWVDQQIVEIEAKREAATNGGE
jgi:hypothetical protein